MLLSAVSILMLINAVSPTFGGTSVSPWRRKWQPTAVFLPGESHGQKSLVGYSARGRKESDTTERLHFSISQCLC